MRGGHFVHFVHIAHMKRALRGTSLTSGKAAIMLDEYSFSLYLFLSVVHIKIHHKQLQR